MRHLVFSLTLLAGPLAVPATAQEAPFPQVVGTWTGSYPVAFPASNQKFPDQSAMMQMELEIYRQEDNLLWAYNRWKPVDDGAWHEEAMTGTFDLHQTTAVTFVESAEAPTKWASTGFFKGTVQDDTLFLTYHGIGSGATFSVALTHQD